MASTEHEMTYPDLPPGPLSIREIADHLRRLGLPTTDKALRAHAASRGVRPASRQGWYAMYTPDDVRRIIILAQQRQAWRDSIHAGTGATSCAE
ncbi:MAG: hypothetical protein WD042_05330 [Phycisphaeraceae bacterium]